MIMENYICRKCGAEFSEDDCYDEKLCPQCGCPADEELDPSNISLEFDLPQEFEVYDNNGEVNGRYKISEKDCVIKDETFYLTIKVEKTYESEDNPPSNNTVVWNVDFPNGYDRCHGKEELSRLEVGDDEELDIEVEAIQMGEYILTLDVE